MSFVSDKLRAQLVFLVTLMESASSELILRVGIFCMAGAGLAFWLFMLSWPLRFIITFLTVGTTALAYGGLKVLKRDGLMLHLPSKIRAYIERQSLLEFMCSSVFQDVPVGDLIALFFFPLKPAEMSRLLARLPESYRRALLTKGLHNLLPHPIHRLMVSEHSEPLTPSNSAQTTMNLSPPSDSIILHDSHSESPESPVVENSSFTTSTTSSSAEQTENLVIRQVDSHQVELEPIHASSILSEAAIASPNHSVVVSRPLDALHPANFVALCQPPSYPSFSHVFMEIMRRRVRREWQSNLLPRIHAHLTRLRSQTSCMEIDKPGRLEVLTAISVVLLLVQLRSSSTTRHWLSQSLTAAACGAQLVSVGVIALLWWLRSRHGSVSSMAGNTLSWIGNALSSSFSSLSAESLPIESTSQNEVDADPADEASSSAPPQANYAEFDDDFVDYPVYRQSLPSSSTFSPAAHRLASHSSVFRTPTQPRSVRSIRRPLRRAQFMLSPNSTSTPFLPSQRSKNSAISTPYALLPTSELFDFEADGKSEADSVQVPPVAIPNPADSSQHSITTAAQPAASISSTISSTSSSTIPASSTASTPSSSSSGLPLNRVLRVASDVALQTTLITKLLVQFHKMSRNMMTLTGNRGSHRGLAGAMAGNFDMLADPGLLMSSLAESGAGTSGVGSTLRHGWLAALRASSAASIAFGASVPMTAMAVWWMWLQRRATEVAKAAAKAANVVSHISPAENPSAGTMTRAMLQSFGLTQNS